MDHTVTAADVENSAPVGLAPLKGTQPSTASQSEFRVNLTSQPWGPPSGSLFVCFPAKVTTDHRSRRRRRS